MTDDRWIYDYWNFISFTVDNQSSLSYVLIIFTFAILLLFIISFSRWRCHIDHHKYLMMMGGGGGEKCWSVFDLVSLDNWKVSRADLVQSESEREKGGITFDIISTPITDLRCSRFIWVKFTILQEFLLERTFYCWLDSHEPYETCHRGYCEGCG